MPELMDCSFAWLHLPQMIGRKTGVNLLSVPLIGQSIFCDHGKERPQSKNNGHRNSNDQSGCCHDGILTWGPLSQSRSSRELTTYFQKNANTRRSWNRMWVRGTFKHSRIQNDNRPNDFSLPRGSTQMAQEFEHHWQGVHSICLPEASGPYANQPERQVAAHKSRAI